MPVPSLAATSPRGRLGRLGGERTPSDGFVYGATAGYDFALSQVRIGPEVEVTASTQKLCVVVPGGDRSCQRTDRDLYVGGRLGYVVDPSVMLYAKVGYSNARFVDKLKSSTGTVSHGRNHNGVRFGGGVEYALTPQFYLSGEYRFSHYQHDEHKIHQNQILGGAGYRF